MEILIPAPRIVGQVKGEIIDGIGRQVYQNGAIYEGEFKNGKFDGLSADGLPV